MPVTKENLEDVFTYHAPTGDQPAKYQRIREAAKHFAAVILEDVPTCGDQQAAIRHVREAAFTANAAIATNAAV